ncbi:formin-like protein 7 [Leguminivora glycinivorella]|uniref:formin-like protein 7 n=1 Tax=Leguminivora glycinivorella TaxID=1035111 RepID=UPI00200FC658|nr:formin-like protein 7 [Leguminivora glycinivorella]
MTCSQAISYGGNRVTEFLNRDIVLVKIYKAHKSSWVKGTIVKRLGATVYLVSLLGCNTVLKKHTNQLLKYKGENVESWHERESSSTGQTSSSEMGMPPIVLSPTTSGLIGQQSDSNSTLNAPRSPDNWAGCEVDSTLPTTSAEGQATPPGPLPALDAETPTPPPLQVGAAPLPPPPPPPAQNAAASARTTATRTDQPTHEPSKRPRNVVNYKKYF